MRKEMRKKKRKKQEKKERKTVPVNVETKICLYELNTSEKEMI